MADPAHDWYGHRIADGLVARAILGLRGNHRPVVGETLEALALYRCQPSHAIREDVGFVPTALARA